MELKPENEKKLTKWIVTIIAICIVIFLGLQNINALIRVSVKCLNLIFPLILGFTFALILNVPMSFVEAHLWTKTKNKNLQNLRKPCAFIISLLVIFSILAGIIWLVIPELAEAIKVVVQGASDYASKLSAMNDSEIAALPLGNLFLDIEWDKALSSLQDWLKNQSGTIVNTAVGTVSSLVGGIFDFFIAFVFAIYILFSKDTLKKQSARLVRVWLPKNFGNWLIHAMSILSKNFRNFVSGQSLEAVILGVLCMLGMAVFALPYAPMVGALVGVTALIPIVGAFIGAAVGAFMILTINPVKAIIFIVFIIVLQQIEGNLIYPKVMGSRVNLPGIWILAAVTVGGGVAGPVGMLVSVPVASSAYVLIREATAGRELKQKKIKKSIQTEK